MELPKADDLRALLAAARETGVAKLEIGGKVGADGRLEPALRVEFHPPSVVEEINRRSPLPGQPDTIAAIKAQVAAETRGERPDILEAIAGGARLIETGNPDPTAPS